MEDEEYNNEDPIDIQEEKIAELLNEFSSHRDEIKKMINELEVIRGKVDTLIPNNLDVRYQRFFEEKVKAVTSFFTSLLEMRKEIAKTIKDEIEIRRKLKFKDDNMNIDELIDIRQMAKKIDDFKKLKIEKQSKRFTESKTQNFEGIDIPGLDQIETTNTEETE